MNDVRHELLEGLEILLFRQIRRVTGRMNGRMYEVGAEGRSRAKHPTTVMVGLSAEPAVWSSSTLDVWTARAWVTRPRDCHCRVRHDNNGRDLRSLLEETFERPGKILRLGRRHALIRKDTN